MYVCVCTYACGRGKKRKKEKGERAARRRLGGMTVRYCKMGDLITVDLAFRGSKHESIGAMVLRTRSRPGLQAELAGKESSRSMQGQGGREVSYDTVQYSTVRYVTTQLMSHGSDPCQIEITLRVRTTRFSFQLPERSDLWRCPVESKPLRLSSGGAKRVLSSQRRHSRGPRFAPRCSIHAKK